MARALWYDDTATGGSAFPISEEFDNIDYNDGVLHSNLSTVWYKGPVSEKMVWSKFKTFLYPGPVPVNSNGTNPYGGDIGQWLNDSRVNPPGPGNAENIKIIIAGGTRVSSLTFGTNIPLRYVIEFHNYGEIQGTYTGLTAVTLKKPLIFKNFGWIRAAGGRGATGGKGGVGGKGAKGGKGGAGGRGATSGGKDAWVQTGTATWPNVGALGGWYYKRGKGDWLYSTNLGYGWVVWGKPGNLNFSATPCGATWSGWSYSFTLCGTTAEGWHEYKGGTKRDECYHVGAYAGSIKKYGTRTIPGCSGGGGGAGGYPSSSVGAGGTGGSGGTGGWGQSFLSPNNPGSSSGASSGGSGGAGAGRIVGKNGAGGCRSVADYYGTYYYGYYGGTGGKGGSSGISTAGGTGGTGGPGGSGGIWGTSGSKGTSGGTGYYGPTSTSSKGLGGGRGGRSADGYYGAYGAGGSNGGSRGKPGGGYSAGGVGTPGKAIVGTRQFLSGSDSGRKNGGLVW